MPTPSRCRPGNRDHHQDPERTQGPVALVLGRGARDDRKQCQPRRGGEVQEDLRPVHGDGVDAEHGLGRDEAHQQLVDPEIEELQRRAQPCEETEPHRFQVLRESGHAEAVDPLRRHQRRHERACHAGAPGNRGEVRAHRGEGDDHQQGRGVDPRMKHVENAADERLPGTDEEGDEPVDDGRDRDDDRDDDQVLVGDPGGSRADRDEHEHDEPAERGADERG